MAAAAQAEWEAVIGLETHVQLGTNSKIFTSASTAFGDDPNTHIDPVVCGLPGTLPVLNQKVLEYAVKAAMALNLNIAEHSKFDRKQYFYPDLPKNYQISQYDEPIAEDGWIEVEVAEKGKDTYLKRIGIERLHMEEDAGKLVHAGSDRLAGSTHSLVDYNRAGVALAEIVSKPDLRTGREARVNLDQPVPVHIIYRTAFTDAKGNLNFRRDIYGRDARIWDALQKAGVELDLIQG